MKKLQFRNLTKEEVEVRVGNGQTLLLYKTARVDANILDEVVGCFNWTKRFYQVKNTMICEVGINLNFDNPEKEPLWVYKGDAGDDDYTTEKVKAEASDSFKRAGFAWGIGRSLYTAPKIKVPNNLIPRLTDKNNPIYFVVSEIAYDKDNNISDLVITADWGKTMVFEFRNGRKVNSTSNTSQNAQKPQQTSIEEDTGEMISEEDKTFLQTYVGNLSAENYEKFFNWLQANYKTRSINGLTKAQGKKIADSFKKGK